MFQEHVILMEIICQSNKDLAFRFQKAALGHAITVPKLIESAENYGFGLKTNKGS